MKAIQTNPTTGGTVFADVELPPLGPHDVLVRVVASGAHPGDVFVRSGAATEPFGLPDVVGLGYDIAGEVQGIGGAVSTFAVGDAVAGLDMSLSAPSRGHAEQVIAAADALAPIPAGLDVASAGAGALNLLTAHQALGLFGPPAGRSLLVTGAAGGVGSLAIALARGAGWSTVVGLARDTDRAAVEAAGATLITTPGGTFDAILDTAALGDAALEHVVDGGSYVGVLPPAVPSAQRGIAVTAVLVAPDGAALSGLLRRVAAGELPVRVAGRVPLADADAAYETVAAGSVRGVWVIEP